MATKKKANQNSFTVQTREENARLGRTILDLKSKVRKLQTENRKLRAELIAKIVKHTPDVNQPISTEVNTKEESHAEFGDSEPKEV